MPKVNATCRHCRKVKVKNYLDVCWACSHVAPYKGVWRKGDFDRVEDRNLKAFFNRVEKAAIAFQKAVDKGLC